MTERHCRGCGTVLSRYNDVDWCGSCLVARRHDPSRRSRVPGDLWLDNAMRAALAEPDWGRVLRMVIARTGLSQTQLAELTGFSQPHISRLIKGQTQCYDIRSISRMADGLGVPRALAGLASAQEDRGVSVSEEAPEEVTSTRRRALLAASLSVSVATILGRGGRVRAVTYSDAVAIREILPRLYELDDSNGGGTIKDLAGWYLDEVDALLTDAEYGGATGRELQVAHGELAEMVGWLDFDAGNSRGARYHFGEAMRSAQLADNLRLEVLVLASQIMLARQAGRPREAIQLAQLAQRRAAGWGTPRLRSLLTAREAVAWAQAGDAHAAGAVMDRAANLFTPTSDAEDPSWLSFYTLAELDAMRSSADSFLGHHGRAATKLRRSVQALGPGYLRNRILYTARLAQAQLADGDERGACDTLGPQLELFGQVSSRRAKTHLDECLAALRRSRAAHARDLIDRAAALGLARAA